MNTNSAMQIGSREQEFCQDNVPPPQIGLWQQHRLDKLFPSVRHVEALA